VGRFGFDPEKHPPYLTMALGAGSVTPMQMASAYSVFANGGIRISPWLISKVSEQRGKVLVETPTPAEPAPTPVPAVAENAPAPAAPVADPSVPPATPAPATPAPEATPEKPASDAAKESAPPEDSNRVSLSIKPLFEVTLPSGKPLYPTMNDVLLLFAVIVLYIELIKSARAASGSIVEHMLSMFVFCAFLVEFLVNKNAGTSAFLVVTMLALIDVVAGFMLASARSSLSGKA
jgi:hypothetical protein